MFIGSCELLFFCFLWVLGGGGVGFLGVTG